MVQGGDVGAEGGEDCLDCGAERHLAAQNAGVGLTRLLGHAGLPGAHV